MIGSVELKTVAHQSFYPSSVYVCGPSCVPQTIMVCVCVSELSHFMVDLTKQCWQFEGNLVVVKGLS